jgi:hypothetical protein
MCSGLWVMLGARVHAHIGAVTGLVRVWCVHFKTVGVPPRVESASPCVVQPSRRRRYNRLVYVHSMECMVGCRLLLYALSRCYIAASAGSAGRTA